MKACILAIGALLCTPAFAQSGLTLYGIVDDSVSDASNEHGASNAYVSNGLAGPRFGLKGIEDIDAQTRAVFVLEQGFNDAGQASSSTSMFQRKAMVGLDDRRYGALTLGRQYSSYYTFVGPLSASGQVDGTQLAQPGDINGLDSTVRLNRSLVYESPDMGGFHAGLTYAFGGLAGSLASGSSFSAAFGYAHGPFATAIGYLKLRNAGQTGGAWDSASSGSFIVSVMNAGYQSARAIDMAALGATYRFDHLVLGLTASQVQYLPGHASLFTDTAIFNSLGTTFRCRLTPSVDLAGGYSYTHTSRSNGSDEGAQYHEVALVEIYHLAKNVSVYVGAAALHAQGETLGALGAGNVVDATAAIGDGATVSNASSSGNQLFGMTGIHYEF
ncbi:MAG: porin [Janthinobacterium lividum]